MNNVRIIDSRRSYMSTKEVHQYKEEITNQKNNPVCKEMTTLQVLKNGSKSMKKNEFCLVRGQLDV